VVRKMLLYEGVLDGTPIPCDFQLKMLFLAEWLDGVTDAGLGKNMIDDAYVPPRYDPISKLYESLGNLNKQAAVDSMNTGYAIVNHAGHSNYGVMSVGPNSLTRTDMYGLSNDTRFTLCYSIGCIAGGFENNDCIGEKFVLAPNGGGFFVGNSRYGWYSPGNPGGGTSEKYDQMFFSCLYDETNARLGAAHGVAKTYYIGWSGNYNAYRWVQFCLNVLGEPENFVWTDIPRSLSPLYASTIGDNAVQFDVRVLAGGQPVESALVCLMKGDEVYLREFTGSNGEVTFTLPALTPGSMYVTITGHNYLPHRGRTEILPAPDIPALLSPPDGTISGNTRPTMIWSSTVGPGGSYTLEYSTSKDFSSDVVSVPGLRVMSYTIPDTASLSDAVYFWHVQAVDVQGFPSGYQAEPWQYTVDTTPPEFSDTYQWPDTTFRGPYFVETLITDVSGILAAYLAYRTDQDTVWRFEQMELLAPQGLYYAYIPGQSCGVTVDYYLYAADMSDPANTASDPSSAPDSVYSFKVLEPTGIDILNPEAYPALLFLSATPNPAGSWVRLDCGLPRESRVKIEVFDSCGRLVRIVADGRFPAGFYSIGWDGRGRRGEMLPSGIYYARLSSDSETVVSKVVKVK
ncbi:MAG: C25 family cysteine peptidase, partial [bacterium]